MSAAEALIRFNKTGNIYYGCYEGTVDFLNSFICTPEECYMDEWEAYSPILYCRKLQSDNDYCQFPEVNDLDDVEIYSDYGDGFYWKGKGSESVKRIKYPLAPFEQDESYPIDGQPDWVKEFYMKLE